MCVVVVFVVAAAAAATALCRLHFLVSGAGAAKATTRGNGLESSKQPYYRHSLPLPGSTSFLLDYCGNDDDDNNEDALLAWPWY